MSGEIRRRADRAGLKGKSTLAPLKAKGAAAKRNPRAQTGLSVAHREHE